MGIERFPFVSILGCTLALIVGVGSARADAPALIAVQGYLTDEAGVPVEGRHRLDFGLYEGETEADPLYSTSYPRIELEKGAFIVYLGEQPKEALDFAVIRDAAELWLEVIIDGNQIISPRTRIGSAPYAGFAQLCGDAATVGGRAPESLASGELGEVATRPSTSCAALLADRPGVASGVYWVKPSTAPGPFQVYCDMTTDGGGWTLVWSNLRGGRGKPMTELPFKAAINTLPRFSGTISSSLESFIVYTGLAHWAPLSPAGKIRYAWSADYGRSIDQMATCSYSFTETATYTLSVTGCAQNTGATMAGLFGSHNGAHFSAYDADNDAHATNCADTYTQTPFWYTGCWDGNINGGGEDEGGGYLNGAYWIGSSATWGAADGTGAGNGWLFVK